jgi:hypothetical protein
MFYAPFLCNIGLWVYKTRAGQLWYYHLAVFIWTGINSQAIKFMNIVQKLSLDLRT